MIKRFPIEDATGALSTLYELIDDIKMGKISALALVFTRKKDGSTCTYKNGCDRVHLLGTLQQLTFDAMASADYTSTEFDETFNGENND